MTTVNTDVLVEVDAALKQDDASQQAPAPIEKEDRQGNVISSLMRTIGSLVLIAAAIAFLVQRWGTMDDMLRYLSFLGFTGVLTAAGFLCGIRMKEDKGARTFLALAASMVTVNFAQLGALLFSTMPKVAGAAIPQALLWTAPSIGVALLTIAGATAVLIPVTMISMRVLARGEDKLLAAAYVAQNVLLLIPSREPFIVELLFALGLMGAFEIDRSTAQSTAAKTREGFIARALLFVPPLILIGRSILLYQTTDSLYGITFLTAAYAAFQHLPRALSEKSRRTCEIISYSLGSIGWLLLAHAIHVGLGLAPSAALPLIAVPIASVLAFLSLRVRSSGNLERTVASFVITASAVLELMYFHGLVSSLYCITIGALTTVVGYTTNRKAFFLCGAACFSFGVLSQIRYAIELYSMSPWVTLAGLGIAIVIASSYIERNYGALVRRVRELGAEIKSWK